MTSAEITIWVEVPDDWADDPERRGFTRLEESVVKGLVEGTPEVGVVSFESQLT